MSTPTTPKVKVLITSTPDYELWTSATLDWLHLLNPAYPVLSGYKASTKYPTRYWKNQDATPVAPAPAPEMLRDAFGEMESLDTTPPTDLIGLTPDPDAPTMQKLISQEADMMIDELLAGHVELIPAPEPKHAGHMIRQSSNPQWWKDMYREGYQSRDTCLNALARIVQGKPTDNRYDTHLLNVIETERIPAILAEYPHLVINQ